MEDPKTITVYSRNEHQVGDDFPVTNRQTGEVIHGTVVGRYAEDDKYSNQSKLGHDENGTHDVPFNAGDGYYSVEIP